MMKKIEDNEHFGNRLARLRKQSGYTQLQFSQEINISRCMVAYYEREAKNPPAHILTEIARALGVTVDQLLNVNTVSSIKLENVRLQKKLAQIERLPAKKKKQILAFIDAILENERFKEQT